MADVIHGDDELAAQFVGWMTQSVAEMSELVAGLDPDASLSETDRETIYGTAHNLKGMGTSFNYDLVTEIGTLLCVYLKTLGAGKATYDFSVLEAHIKALQVVAEHTITGDGGERGQALVARLTELVGQQEVSS